MSGDRYKARINNGIMGPNATQINYDAAVQRIEADPQAMAVLEDPSKSKDEKISFIQKFGNWTKDFAEGTLAHLIRGG
jgi:hypothetical protein